jgi:hypothetical protein
MHLEEIVLSDKLGVSTLKEIFLSEKTESTFGSPRPILLLHQTSVMSHMQTLELFSQNADEKWQYLHHNFFLMSSTAFLSN